MSKSAFRHILTFALVTGPFILYSQTSLREYNEVNAPRQSATYRYYTLLNINDIALNVRNDGYIGYGGNSTMGLVYPRGTSSLLSQENILWVGKVVDDRSPVIRTGGGVYSSGVQPGVILSKGVSEEPSSPTARAYRIRKDFATANLRKDAAEMNGISIQDVTNDMLGAVRSQYEKDWQEWPWQRGAPFEDTNGNNIMDEGESPGFLNADQVIWFAYNDLNDAVSRSFYASPASGLETQVTIWGYKDVPEFENVVFKRYRMIYKGTESTPQNATIDSMYIGQWADADAGYYGDDLAGCDTLLNLGFVYNATGSDEYYRQYFWQTPGVGYVLLQGPLVLGDPSDEGIKDFRVQSGLRNVPMSAFLLNATGDAIGEPGAGRYTLWYWNVLRGFALPFDVLYSNTPWVNPDGSITKFMASGDPITQTGWVDGLGTSWYIPGVGGGYSIRSSDRRFIMSTGPFTMALGDTQDVVIAIVAGMGADGRQSVTAVKHYAKRVRSVYPYLAERAAGS